MAIPNGYRLLTIDDVGKVFGVDLEPSIFIDSSATLTNSIITASFVGLNSSNNFIRGVYMEDGFEYQIEFNYGTYSYFFFVTHGGFNQDNVAEINAVSNINGTITAVGYSNDDDWNNWLYVKDKADPYNIKIKNKEGIKLLTKDKTIEFTDDVKVTIDESLLGGGEAKKYSFEIEEYDNGGWGPFDVSIDGDPFVSGYYISGTANIVIIATPKYNTYGNGEARITDVSITGGTFIGVNYDNSISNRYSIIIVKLTEDNAKISYRMYD